MEKLLCSINTEKKTVQFQKREKSGCKLPSSDEVFSGKNKIIAFNQIITLTIVSIIITTIDMSSCYLENKTEKSLIINAFAIIDMVK